MLGRLPLKEGGRGTEYMALKISNGIFDELKNLHMYNWVLLPGANAEDEMVARIMQTIVWMHVPSLDIDKRPDIVVYFKDPEIRKNTKAYIFQSEFHKRDMIKAFDLPEEKVFVLNNTFDPILNVPKPKNKVNLIYVQQTSRGLDILIDAFKSIKDDNITLTVHGCTCSECSWGKMDGVDTNDPRISLVGYVSKEQYIKNLQKSHLLIYPCTFEETAGISLMEAMSAGIKIVTTDLGAIPETTLGHAKLIKKFPRLEEDQRLLRDWHVKRFRKEIKKAVKEIRRGKFDPTDQIADVSRVFGWESVKQQWIDFNAKM